uniref:Protein phosphatase 1, regulatory (inhibitor) subunit 14Ba n=1 Tax=Neogobius melanostomus TaxID=47308 RepID=A0A8C6TU00_9GOBI
MAAVTSPETSPQPRVYFQTPAGTTEEPETPVRKQGRVTVKYDRKELRKRLNLEEWIIDQLTDLYDCEEEAIPELEIDVDELLDMPSDIERAARVKDLLVDCFKPTEVSFSYEYFILYFEVFLINCSWWLGAYGKIFRDIAMCCCLGHYSRHL